MPCDSPTPAANWTNRRRPPHLSFWLWLSDSAPSIRLHLLRLLGCRPPASRAPRIALPTTHCHSTSPARPKGPSNSVLRHSGSERGQPSRLKSEPQPLAHGAPSLPNATTPTPQRRPRVLDTRDRRLPARCPTTTRQRSILLLVTMASQLTKERPEVGDTLMVVRE